ncbi:ABC-three component system protein [Geobacter benzoatilyticus]|uniref:SMEK domain-containing protein n=1 Tax=Geobacter benzoatilyticus TaxID=2815309 RepID=A0ABX7Q2W7_9BACT|nr:ABC-three component system protein [Geobacter benzoatilyticus]QSV45441.1 SMEK domain-containing protein [Geobacter benzoatilyticus]
MNRLNHVDYIIHKLSALATEIEQRGKLNLLDLHRHSEDFYAHFFNELFGWRLQNLNTIKPNAEAIDLIDHTSKIVIQVSATATKAKVESALTKDLSEYNGYAFKFISISKDAGDLRDKSLANPHRLTFDPKTDIHDLTSILRYISGLGADNQRRIVAFLKKELGVEVDPVKLESNLSAMITILAKEDWSSDDAAFETIPFDIDNKIEFNDLNHARDIIEEYSLHYPRIARIYADYDREGNNKSLSVLNAIKRFYVAHKARLSNDALFDKVTECVSERVQESANFVPIPEEELDLCINILVVDAFTRCKIFKNPVGYAHAAS